MRILVCGDIHCKPDILINALNASEWDRFIFLGDACDNFGATQEDNLKVVKTIIKIKKEYGEKFVWLLGNHDWGYYDDSIRMTGHIHPGSANVAKLFEDSIDLWELFHAEAGFLFSHAGISPKWLANLPDMPYKELKQRRGLSSPINEVGYACGGSSDAPSLLWARPDEVGTFARVLNLRQVVGHTPVPCITQWRNREDLIVCDTFSQYPDGSFVGDKTLLLIERRNILTSPKISAINYLTGEKMYSIPGNRRKEK